MAIRWTREQENAIYARGGTLLVSAAAGSGKTAVLVERIVKRITDESDACDIDELLVVTYTRSAAAEMRERITKRLSEMMADEPNNQRIMRQQFLLPRAKIGTIDSFCGELVRENAHILGIPADYKIVSGTQYESYLSAAAALAVDEMYSRNNQGFYELVELVSSGRDDSALIKNVIAIYKSATAYPFPEKMLEAMTEPYENVESIEDTHFFKMVMDYGGNAFKYMADKYELVSELQQREMNLFDKYYDFTLERKKQMSSLSGIFKNGNWDEAREAVFAFEFGKLPPSKGIKGHSVKILTDAARSEEKAILNKIKDLMPVSSNDFVRDAAMCLPAVRALSETVIVFMQKLSELMERDGVMGFSDVTHTALKMLYEDGGSERTALAREVSNRFVEILVDEYQDVNLAQHMIFSAVSRDGNNIFMVGDVKQSIYSFRQAMPEIFIDMRSRFAPHGTGEYPAKISLDKNFRSSRSVVDCVNYCFERLMGEDTGGIDYGDEDRLVCGAQYDENSPVRFELVGKKTVNTKRNAALQAQRIAEIIKEIMASGRQVTLRDGTKREPKYSDFCILLRRAKSQADTYVKVLKKNGISSEFDVSGDFFDYEEIRIMLSLMKAVDDPLLDVELMSVMMSPLYGFTTDEMAKIRMTDRHCPLFSAVSISAQNGDAHSKKLVDDLAYYRLLASTVTSDEFLRRVYDKTSIVSLSGAMGAASQRRANLMLLLDYASGFESSGFRGLSAFVNYMQMIENGSGNTDAGVESKSGGDGVRIMTIHKSKGLEFPFCIVSGMDVSASKSPESNILFDPLLRVGFNYRDVETLTQYQTVQRAATAMMIYNNEMADELRALYVAMTRAKEMLIMVAAVSDTEDLFAKCTENYTGKLPVHAVFGKGTEAEIILTNLMRHPGASDLSYTRMLQNEIPADFELNINITELEPDDDEDVPGDNVDLPVPEVSEEIRREFIRRIEYEYPFLALSSAVSKTSASDLSHLSLDGEFFACEIPAFMSRNSLTAAERGTAAHRFLQCCDYSRIQDIEGEIERLVCENKLTRRQADAIDRGTVGAFFESELFLRMSRSGYLRREYSFAVNMSVCDIYEDMPEEFSGESVMVQGAVDCFFEEDGELVVVDYKTDRVKSGDELVERYAPQLKMYARAVAECTEIPVKECLIYSLYLKKCIRVQ